MESAWKLKKIVIEYAQWGEFKNKYIGKIEFDNEESEAFTFNIRPEMAAEYLKLMQSEVTKSASELGEKLLQSLPQMIENNAVIALPAKPLPEPEKISL